MINRIGIGITTRNRPNVLDMCLEHIKAFRPESSSIVVVDDASDPEYASDAVAEWFADNRTSVRMRQRVGVARAKNQCIKALAGCDYIFLFDEDCFPRKAGWAEAFIKASEKTSVQHLMYLRPFRHIQPAPLQPLDGVVNYTECIGGMLMFTSEALDVLGGYDERFGLYGWEHAQISIRASYAGLTRKLIFATIPDAREYIYSMDIDRGDYQPPFGEVGEDFHSSMAPGEVTEELLLKYRPLMMNPPIYCPIS